MREEIIRSRTHTRLDERRDYGEDRYIVYGYVEQRLFNCVFTIRDGIYHIISVRKANDREVKRYGR